MEVHNGSRRPKKKKTNSESINTEFVLNTNLELLESKLRLSRYDLYYSLIYSFTTLFLLRFTLQTFGPS